MQSRVGAAGDRLGENGAERVKVAEILDSQIVAGPAGTRVVAEDGAESGDSGTRRRHWVRWLILGVAFAAILLVGLPKGISYVRELLDTVSTDDAFVSGHITYVSPRIEDVATEVLVDQDDRVDAGQLLVRLDRQPFELTVAQNDASLAQARANLAQARAQVRSQIAQARGAYYRRKNAQETVRQQVATLSARVATQRSRRVSASSAHDNLRRGVASWAPTGGISKEDLDQRENALKVAVEDERRKQMLPSRRPAPHSDWRRHTRTR